jgi:hypothetical protein
MRAGRGAGLVLALVLGACRSSSEAPVDAGITVAPSTLHCETLLPADVREFALPGFTLQEERPCPTCGPLCALRSAAEPEVRVSLAYDCQARFEGMETEALLAPTLKAGGLQVSAMGRAAARRSPAPGMLQVVAWDDDTPCAIVVTWLGGDTERAVDVTRTALHATTPASITGTPATLADLALPPPAAVDATPPLAADVAGLLPSADAGVPLPPVDAGTPAAAVAPPPRVNPPGVAPAPVRPSVAPPVANAGTPAPATNATPPAPVTAGTAAPATKPPVVAPPPASPVTPPAPEARPAPAPVPSNAGTAATPTQPAPAPAAAPPAQAPVVATPPAAQTAPADAGTPSPP